METLEKKKIESWGPSGPWTLEISELDTGEAFKKFSGRKNCLFFDSAMRHESLGRYSFLMADPCNWIQAEQADTEDWNRLCHQVESFPVSLSNNSGSDLPPFLGGLAGLVSYDWAAAVEEIPAAKRDDFRLPKLALGIYDGVVVWDHLRNHTWIIACGFPEREIHKRQQAAADRIHEVWSLLFDDTESAPFNSSEEDSGGSSKSAIVDLSKYYRLGSDRIGKHFPESPIKLDPSQQVLTGTELNRYLDSIKKAKEHLERGDIFQVNLAQQLMVETPLSGPEVYQNLRSKNPAPFASYLDLGKSQVISASPERLFSLQSDGVVQTRPIKGTCPRTGDLEGDAISGQQLQNSSKDCAENVMIVDLLRNDLSRVCKHDSVCVKSLCQLEPYQYVQHLTSVVEGILEDGKSARDVLLALFPGGSITGAPKVRAMEIIQELEPVARGAYCGSIGYVSFGAKDETNRADFNILIRTMTLSGGWCQVPVGGGIVLDSDPKSEFDETLVKAHGMLKALL